MHCVAQRRMAYKLIFSVRKIRPMNCLFLFLSLACLCLVRASQSNFLHSMCLARTHKHLHTHKWFATHSTDFFSIRRYSHSRTYNLWYLFFFFRFWFFSILMFSSNISFVISFVGSKWYMQHLLHRRTHFNWNVIDLLSHVQSEPANKWSDLKMNLKTKVEILYASKCSFFFICSCRFWCSILQHWCSS